MWKRSLNTVWPTDCRYEFCSKSYYFCITFSPNGILVFNVLIHSASLACDCPVDSLLGCTSWEY